MVSFNKFTARVITKNITYSASMEPKFLRAKSKQAKMLKVIMVLKWPRLHLIMLVVLKRKPQQLNLSKKISRQKKLRLQKLQSTLQLQHQRNQFRRNNQLLRR